ncbi:hypothetical protein V6x_53510 [Gimesia chilikensis]|uniref:Uncharacterized protein n=1 Tax=Gimesia chilikensis TaxID=2605989 RepID=A0A517WK44_9PLAN|nr:TauD/TfdA family dioxygenase [Gimesia chilikensis]QDU05611.1 hypothetical protein V6x_53510 [Gimesia chilikensis]
MQVKTLNLEKPQTLPLLIEPADQGSASLSDLIEYISRERNWLDQTLLEQGGVLLRGFTIQEIDEFQDVAQALIPELKPYVEGQSPRTKVTGNVYTSTEFPA